jgi:hypothetical protein
VLEFSQVRIGDGEPVACSRCGTRETALTYRSADDIAADVAQAVRDYPGAPGPNVELVGPEPLGHPELPAVVASAIAAGVARLRLHTDAVGFGSAGNASGAIAAGVTHVRFTLLGGTPGVHDVLADAPGALDATLLGVRSFVEAGKEQERAVHVSALLPLCRHTSSDLPTAVLRAVEAGVSGVLIRIEDGGVDMAGALPWIGAACDTGVVNGVWVEVEGVPFCLMAEGVLHLADVVRERPGAHGPGCAECALRDWCAGGPANAAAGTLARLRAPDGAVRLAERVRVARQGVS